jgi:hypothetical protein
MDAFSREPLRGLRGIALLACWLLAGCAGETVFQSDFAKFYTHSPPIGNQKVGTSAVDPVSDQYVWATGPSGWVWISRDYFSDPVPRAALLCQFAEFKGDGTYVFSTILYMPTGTGAATIQFEPFGQSVTSYADGFLRLDLMPDNTVRIDDNNATTFGIFPRDQVFILQVTLKINPTPTARILLSGAGASGEREYTILPVYAWRARQYGAIRLWIGYPWSGYFEATSIVVKRS